MRIAVFAKAPRPGRAKTRLIPALGAGGAAALAREMLERTVAEAMATGIDTELWGDPDPLSWYQGPALPLFAQGGGDLGARLARAAARRLPVLLVGTDCPGLDRGRLAAAAAALAARDAVIHPTEDGGYALLGLARFDPSLFEGIAWSTDRVVDETVSRIRALGWSLHVGETLRDIDVPADLPHLRHPRASGDPASPPPGLPLSRE